MGSFPATYDTFKVQFSPLNIHKMPNTVATPSFLLHRFFFHFAPICLIVKYPYLPENGHFFPTSKNPRLHENAIVNEKRFGTIFDWSMHIYWYPTAWRACNRFHKTFVFTHPHEYSKTAFSKISSLESGCKKIRFRWPFSIDTASVRVDGRPNRRKKISVFEQNGHV